MNKIYVAMIGTTGDSCEGYASCIGAFKLKEDAEACVHNSIEERCELLADSVDEVDFDEMYVVAGEYVAQWSIDEVEVQ